MVNSSIVSLLTATFYIDFGIAIEGGTFAPILKALHALPTGAHFLR
jgi:hypothetical protein